MPGGGKVFIRPEVTTHTSIAEQSAEFDTLQSGTLVVTDQPGDEEDLWRVCPDQ
jgi:hypothetical protein